MLGSKDRREAILSLAGLALTIFAALMLMAELGGEAVRLVSQDLLAGAEQSVFLLIVVLLIYGNVVYQLTRFGHYWRMHQHRPKDRVELEAVYDASSRPAALTVLVPSYKEEPDIIWQTLMSAALMEWPNRRIALLIDDPPNPRGGEDQRVLAEARALPRKIQSLLSEPGRRLGREQADFAKRLHAGSYSAREETDRLCRLYEYAADWLDGQARQRTQKSHTDRLFVQRILEEPAREHRERAQQLRHKALSSERAEREFRRLASLFDAEVVSFERKQFVNLSQEPNKAMNLNAYISLLGRSFQTRRQAHTNLIEEVSPGLADLHIPLTRKESARIIGLHPPGGTPLAMANFSRARSSRRASAS